MRGSLLPSPRKKSGRTRRQQASLRSVPDSFAAALGEVHHFGRRGAQSCREHPQAELLPGEIQGAQLKEGVSGTGSISTG